MAQSQKPTKNAGASKQPPRAKKGAGAGKKAEDDRDETLQAVVLADSFETRFNPFTLETPRCLLPLANTPLIEYTLEFLAMSGVADIFIYCGAHTDEVERYIQASKWHPLSSPASPFSTLEIVKTTARSVGDAMRDLDARDLITGDFLLVHGDLVSNLPIDAALTQHRARRIADKNAIMTMVLRSGGLGSHRTKSNGITPVFVVEPTKNRCLHYEEMNPLQSNKYLNIDPDLFSEHSEIEIRTDLIDCGIDICTPDVLALWAESFDYEVPRRHFLHGVLKDYELNGKTIHTEIVSDHYAARAFNLQAYEAITKDVLGRWTYPLVPDSNLVAGQSYKFQRGGLCKENGVILARTCKIGKRTVLGKDSNVGDGSTIVNSTIGRRCQIGKNVTISNAYIWDDVIIGDGTIVEKAIIASEAVVGQKCKIAAGSLISYGVKIADNQEITDGVRITRGKRTKDDDDCNTPTQPTDPKVVGEGGEGYEFQDDEEFEDEESSAFHSSLVYSTHHLNISAESISTISSELSTSTPVDARSRHSSFAGSISDDEHQGSSETFHHDAVAGLLDTLREGGDFDSAKLEFMGLRLSNDANDYQIRRAIAAAFTKYIAELVTNEKIEAAKAANDAFGRSGAAKFLKEVAIGLESTEEGQVEFLLCLQKGLVQKTAGPAILAAVCQRLYHLDVLEEEALLKWWGEAEERDGEDGELKRVREKTGVFIEWLKEADEEESSEEDEDDEDDSE
ncbi:translation initiation factor eIF-2B epsilon subunit, GEF [Clarireedia jacksonii]